MKLRFIPNALSFLRIALTPVFIYLFFISIKSNIYSAGVLILYAVIIITDFTDGRIARVLHAQSGFGKILDVTADAAFIFSTLIFFNFLGIIPAWLTIIIFLKFSEFILTSVIFSRKTFFIFDPAGRAAAVMYYIIPLWIFIFRNNLFIMKIFILIVLMITFLSFVMRIYGVMKKMVKENNPK